MIGNISRITQFNECRRKAWNWHQLRLKNTREDEPLIRGDAVHKGFAKLFATGKAEEATEFAVKTYKERSQPEGAMILPEEKVLIEQGAEYTRFAVKNFAREYQKMGFTVLWPEVEFQVELPNTMHHCWFMHQLVYPEIPYNECECETALSHTSPTCFMPHYLRGKTDGVVQQQGQILLLETKTSAITGNIYFDKFYLDFQPTGYMYGIWKKMNVRPHGFILNVVKKPNKNFKGSMADFFDRDPFERNVYWRTDEDLAEFEREVIEQLNDYERAFSRAEETKGASIYKNTKSCTNWNRRCYYWDLCKNNHQLREGEFITRELDYVDESYYKLAGLPIPAGEKVKQDDTREPE